MTKNNYGIPEKNFEIITFKSLALQGNAIGDPHNRSFAVVLPPSYHRQGSQKRFGVLYWLHGFGHYANGHLINLPEMAGIYHAMAKGEMPELILVTVDGTNFFGGSYYSNSKVIGNYENYVGIEIVKEVDRRFRTEPGRNSRAIAGFSMGGHGALKIAMKFSYNFSIVGSLSGSPLSIRYRKIIYKMAANNHKPVKTKEDFRKTVTFDKNWNLAALYAKAAGFVVNMKNPPLYTDLPFRSNLGEQDDPIWTGWLESDPLGSIARYASNLRSYKLIYMDHGDDETLLGTEDFDRELVRYGIGHVHYIYRGDHIDKLGSRIKRMIKTIALHWDL